MRNYNVWLKAQMESYNYTRREDRRETTAACVSQSASSSKETQRFPLSLLDKNMFCDAAQLSGKIYICCLIIFNVSVCAQTD